MDGEVEMKTLGGQYCNRTACLVHGSEAFGWPLLRYLAHLSEKFPGWRAADGAKIIVKRIAPMINATITYEIRRLRHPFDKEQRDKSVTAWCLCRVTSTLAVSDVDVQAIALFDSDTEASLFQRHIFAGGTVTIDKGAAELFTLQAKNRAQGR